jgi:DNA-directed RNA polymerase subunit N (RpoN/RPB10)
MIKSLAYQKSRCTAGQEAPIAWLKRCCRVPRWGRGTELIQEKLKMVVIKWLNSALEDHLKFNDSTFVNMPQIVNKIFKFLHKLGSDRRCCQRMYQPYALVERVMKQRSAELNSSVGEAQSRVYAPLGCKEAHLATRAHMAKQHPEESFAFQQRRSPR